MMMKIFGAVLIVSGGFLVGKIRSSRMFLRLRILSEVADLFRSFDWELRESRRSPDEVLRSKGDLAIQILECRPIKGLTSEDMEQLEGHLCCLKTASYREALDANKAFTEQLDKVVEALKREHSSGGKALPLVTATIGLFVAVMLF